MSLQNCSIRFQPAKCIYFNLPIRRAGLDRIVVPLTGLLPPIMPAASANINKISEWQFEIELPLFAAAAAVAADDDIIGKLEAQTGGGDGGNAVDDDGEENLEI